MTAFLLPLALPSASAGVLPAIAVRVTAVFLMVAVGALVRRQRWLSALADATLLALFVRLFLPALIFQQVLGNAALRTAENVLLPPLVGAALVGAGFFAAAGLLGVLRRTSQAPAGLADDRQRRTFVLCTGVFNYGYVTIPLVQSLFPPATGDGTLGVLFIFNVGVEATVWGAGVMILQGKAPTAAPAERFRRVLSPPVAATVVAIGLNLLALDPSAWPAPGRAGADALSRVVDYLAVGAIPTGLLLTGATIWDDWRQARLRAGALTVAWAAVLRLALLPAGFIALALALPMSLELKRIVVLQAAMPAAVFPIVLSRHYGGDVGVALRIVVGTVLLALVTMPIWAVVGLSLIE